MTEAKIDLLSKLDLPALETLRATYEHRNDSASLADVRAAIGRKGAVQTGELDNCGQLFPHRVELDSSGLGTRPAITWTGDPKAWMKHFESPGAVGRFDASICTGENSPAAKAAAAKVVKS
jgi:hypothetical protein